MRSEHTRSEKLSKKMLISSDTILRQYIPNALVTVQGEQSLFEKLHSELALSEQWLTTHILGETLHTQLLNTPEDDDSTVASHLFEGVGGIVAKVIATDAFLRAIPSLDLVLTPNGFGVVSNTNIAPASKDRVERLQQSLLQSRDCALDTLLHSLLQDTAWRTTPQGRYFLATLFQTLSSLNGSNHSTLNAQLSWDYFRKVHSSLILIEQELADKFISQALYARLRNYHPAQTTQTTQATPSTQTAQTTPTTTEAIALLIPLLQAIELELLQGKPLPYQQLIQLVDYIRTRSETFPEWQTSPTATLFQPHTFENQKSAAGYWF